MRQIPMRSLGTNARHRRHRASGFSLIELLITTVILLIIAAVTFINFGTSLRNIHLNSAYNLTMSVMRQAHDNAVAQAIPYEVIFIPGYPSGIQVVPLAGSNLPTFTYQLPRDIWFYAPGVNPSPDGLGTGANAIDFGYLANGGGGGQAFVWFCPDGSAQQSSTCNSGGYANWDSGVVYIDIRETPTPGKCARALSLWGGTGRIHGWQLYSSGGTTWVRQ